MKDWRYWSSDSNSEQLTSFENYWINFYFGVRIPGLEKAYWEGISSIGTCRQKKHSGQSRPPGYRLMSLGAILKCLHSNDIGIKLSDRVSQSGQCYPKTHPRHASPSSCRRQGWISVDEMLELRRVSDPIPPIPKTSGALVQQKL